VRAQHACERSEVHIVVIDAEKALHSFVEADIQGVIVQSGILVHAVNVTYWLSQFPVLGLSLLWIYFLRNDAFVTVRNWVFATNLLALIALHVLAILYYAIVKRDNLLGAIDKPPFFAAPCAASLSSSSM